MERTSQLETVRPHNPSVFCCRWHTVVINLILLACCKIWASSSGWSAAHSGQSGGTAIRHQHDDGILWKWHTPSLCFMDSEKVSPPCKNLVKKFCHAAVSVFSASTKITMPHCPVLAHYTIFFGLWSLHSKQNNECVWVVCLKKCIFYGCLWLVQLTELWFLGQAYFQGTDASPVTARRGKTNKLSKNNTQHTLWSTYLSERTRKNVQSAFWIFL